LFYADDVDILDEIVQTIKKNKEAWRNKDKKKDALLE